MVSVALAAAGARAETIFNTLDDTQDGLVTMSGANSRWYAQSFTTTATGTTLSSVELDLGTVSGAANVQIWIYDTVGSLPGSAIGTPLYSGTQTITSPLLLDGLGMNLNALTQYWVYVQRISGSSLLWGYTDDVTFDNAYTVNGGGSYTLLTTAPLRMTVNTTSPVPEIDPAGFGSVAALITGALGLIERRRLKAKAA
jgi:hypothetical protein